MKRLALLAAAAALLPAAAAAQTAEPATTTQTPAPAAPASASDGRIDLARALEAAKGRVDGGILEAELEDDDGERVWEIDIAAGDTVHEVKVNATTGAVVAADEKTIEGTWRSWFDADSLADSQRISGTLAATIGKAEATAGGRITKIELDEDDGKLRYELDVETANGEQEMILDPATGAVTPDE